MTLAMNRRVASSDGVESGLLACIELCRRGARACLACADVCLGSDHVAELNACIRFSLEAADRCFEVAALSPRRADSDPYVLDRLLENCAGACERAAAECRRHAMRYPVCRAGAEACEECSAACRVTMTGVAAAL